MLFALAKPHKFYIHLAPWHGKISEKKNLSKATKGSFKGSPESLNNKLLMDGNGAAPVF